MINSQSNFLTKRRVPQVRVELTTSAWLLSPTCVHTQGDTAYKYGALTDCATGAAGLADCTRYMYFEMIGNCKGSKSMVKRPARWLGIVSSGSVVIVLYSTY